MKLRESTDMDFDNDNVSLSDIKKHSQLSEEEFQTIVYNWNCTETPYHENKTIHQLFEEQVEKSPENIAVVFEDKQLTYRELNMKANQLASCLKDRYKKHCGKEIQRNTLIGIYIDRSLDMIIAILGILKAGAAYVPFDSDAPEERLKFKINDCGCSIVLTDTNNLKSLLILAETDTFPLSLDGYRDEIEKFSDINPEIINTSADLAYIIYTSGSTGKPKGVMIEHKSVVNLLKSLENVYDFSEEYNKSTFFTSYVFDVSVSEIFAPLINGAELHIFSDSVKKLPVEIGNYIREKEINYLYLPPVLLSVLPRDKYESLRTVIYAGEPCDMETAGYWSDKVRLFNLYGPTEATIYAIGKQIVKNEVEQIGKPMTNVKAYVLNTDLDMVPIGEEGELYLGGEGVARGYFNRAELTAECFIDNPFISEEDIAKGNNLKIYKTGDVVKWLPDGNIEYFGRNDDQIKLRGYRIELGEIEAKLNSHESVKQSVVLCKGNDDSKYLAAFFIPSGKEIISSNDKQDFVSDWQDLYESEYREVNNNVESDFGVWNSSYTGEPISLIEMEEWRSSTVNRILSYNPQTILEIGCGTGLLMYKLLKYCNLYYGTDFSESVINSLKKNTENKNFENVYLAAVSADETDKIELINKSELPDTVIINSVIQYFPDGKYLDDVLSKSIDVIEENGILFIGDVRDYRLIGEFYISIELYKAQKNNEEISIKALSECITEKIKSEKELNVSPEYFIEYAKKDSRVSYLEILPRRGVSSNEMNCFRYDVIIHTDKGEESSVTEIEWADFGKGAVSVEKVLDGQKKCVGIKNYPNKRIWDCCEINRKLNLKDRQNTQNVLESFTELQKQKHTFLFLEDLYKIADELGYELYAVLSIQDKSAYDLTFYKKGFNLNRKALYDKYYTISESCETLNNPVGNLKKFTVNSDTLASYLSTLLPDYMVPSVFISIDEFPQNTSGKIDRNALAEIEVKNNDEMYVPPSTEFERQLCKLWQEILGIEKVGMKDEFLKLGGNSILAIKLVNSINPLMDLNLKVSDIFKYKEIGSLAEFLQSENSKFIYKDFQISGTNSNLYEPFQLSNVQQAYYWGRFDEFDLGNISTHLYSEYKFKYIDVEKLEFAVNKMISNHIELTTVFKNGKQCFLKEHEYYKVHLNEFSSEKNLLELRNKLSHKIFDIEKFPLFELIVSKCVFEDDEEYFILHVGLDLLLFDATSLTMFFTELTKFYNAPDTKLDKLNINFKDYIEGAKKVRESKLLEETKKYWIDKLPDYNFDYNLPFKENLAQINQPKFSRYTGIVDAEKWNSVKEKAEKFGLGITVMPLFAYANVLKYWSNQDNFTINITLFNRLPLHEQVNDIFGDFTVLELFNYHLKNGNTTIKDLLKSIHDELWEDIEHNIFDGVDFQRLIRDEYNIPGSSIISPVVFTSLLGHDWEKNKLLSNDFIEKNYSVIQTSQVVLDNIISETPKGLVTEWYYVEQAFDEDTIEKMYADYSKIIEFLADADWENDLALDLEPSEDVKNVIDNANSFIQPLIEDTLFNAIENAVIDNDLYCNTAVIDTAKNSEYTYAELLKDIDKIAGGILKETVPTSSPTDGKLIGILSEKGYNQAAAAMGIMKSGHGYLPMSPEWPAGRIDEVLIQGKVKQILISREMSKNEDLCGCLDKYKIKIIEDVINTVSDTKKQMPQVSPDDIAYVIFTSGSTGKPKGVTISHRGALNTIDAVNKKFSINSEDRVLALSELSFDLSVYDVFGILLTGGIVVFPDQKLTKEPSHWVDVVNKHNITVWNTVPQLADLFIDKLFHTDTEYADSVRLFLLSGDWIPLDLPEKINKCYSQSKVVSLGGATEGSIWSIWYDVDIVNPDWLSIPYGYAMPNQKMYVLSNNGSHCPFNVIGEIHIGGIGVALNYWGDEEKTAQSYIDHPKLGRLYKTGDLGKWKKKGYIEFCGRKDNQVKVGGFRIELGEIKNKLLEFKDIARAAVLCKEKAGNKYIAAYYTLNKPEDNLQATESEVKDFLALQLPDYMVPALFIELDKFPLNASGKVNLKALPDPEFKENENNYVPPSTEIERKLCNIWQEVLDIEKVGITDDFFKLGGNSIFSIKLVNLINFRMNVEVRVTEIFKNRNISELVELLQKQKTGFLYKDFQIDSSCTDLYTPFELTNVQQAYYWGRFGDFDLSNISTQFYTEYKFKYIDVEKLEFAINKLISYHIELRTIFKDGKQFFLKDCQYYKVHVNQLNSEVQLLELRNSLSHKIFDTEEFPLFKFIISKCEFPDTEKIYLLHINMDALLFDATSLVIFFSELTQLYNNPDTALNKLNITFKDYLERVKKVRESRIFEKAETYWINKLPDYNFDYNLPLKKNISEITKPKFSNIVDTVDIDKWNLIKEKAEKYSLGVTAVPLFAYAHVLSYWSNQRNFTVNLTLFNRLPLHEQVNDILGDFTVLELFNYHVKDSNTVIKDMMKSIHDELWSDIEHNVFDGVDFQRLIRNEYNIPNSSVISPVVLTSILGQKWESFEAMSDNIYIGENYTISQTSQVILDNVVYETNKGFTAEWNYVEQLFDKDTLEVMHSDYCRLIEFLAEADWENDIMPKPKLQKAVKEAIKKANSFSQPLTDDTLFSAIENTVADSNLYSDIAVIDSGNNCEYTYEKLLNDADKIAAFMLSENLCGDKNRSNTNLVAVLSEKGYNQVVSTFGIMKSGLGYLPLNSEWPGGRINEVLSEGKVKLLLISKKISEDENLCKCFKKYKLLIIEDIIKTESKTKNNLPKVSPDDIAYVIFTSGSTGKPKGVTISHRGALNTINAVNKKYGIDTNDKALALSELSFDLSVYDIFGILAAGGTIVFPKQELTKESSHWVDLVNKYKITIWNTVPQLAGLLVDELVYKGIKHSETLRLFLLSGDWIPLDLPEKLRKCYSQSQIVSLGGATEGSIWSIWNDIEKIDKNWKSIPYGYAMPNQKMYVLNEFKDHCPFDVIGEIHIGGIGVALNYWGDEEKTALSYISHPKLGRLYKTGDLGKWKEGGYIEFCGRKDKQVKVNGYRIELEEISSKLKKIPGVENALVSVQKKENKDFIVGYIVSSRVKELCEDKEKQEFILSMPGIDKTSLSIFKLDTVTDKAKYKLRKSYRKYISKKVDKEFISAEMKNSENNALSLMNPSNNKNSELSVNGLSEIFSNLSCVIIEDKILPKYLYPSAGSSYSVRGFLNLKEKLQGIEKGYYYFHPLDQTLNKSSLFRKPDYNCIELISYLPAIEPHYGEASEKFAYIEAGHMLALSCNTLVKNSLKYSIEINNTMLDDKNLLLATIYFDEKSTAEYIPELSMEMFSRKDDSFILKTHKLELDKINIFDQVNWYCGRILESAGALVGIKGDENPINLIFSGIVFQLLSEKLYHHNYGSCMLGYLPFDIKNSLYSMSIGCINDEMKEMSELNAEEKSIKEIVDRYVKDFLPDYMLPYEYLTIGSIPLTANGKLDTGKLPSIELSSQNTVYVAPGNDMEEKLCDIFKEIFDIEKIGVKDNYYDYGMNSISAMRIVSAISGSLGKITLKELLTHEKISDLSNCIEIVSINYEDEEIL